MGNKGILPPAPSLPDLCYRLVSYGMSYHSETHADNVRITNGAYERIYVKIDGTTDSISWKSPLRGIHRVAAIVTAYVLSKLALIALTLIRHPLPYLGTATAITAIIHAYKTDPLAVVLSIQVGALVGVAYCVYRIMLIAEHAIIKADSLETQVKAKGKQIIEDEVQKFREMLQAFARELFTEDSEEDQGPHVGKALAIKQELFAKIEALLAESEEGESGALAKWKKEALELVRELATQFKTEILAVIKDKASLGTQLRSVLPWNRSNSQGDDGPPGANTVH